VRLRKAQGGEQGLGEEPGGSGGCAEGFGSLGNHHGWRGEGPRVRTGTGCNNKA
jgi:hypothetical protein